MNRLFVLLLALVLCVSAFSGCGAKEALVTYTYDDLSISIPENFIDLSDEEFAEGLTFLFGFDPVTVNGFREDKAVLQAAGLDLSVETYADLLLKANNITAAPEQKNGIYTYSYEAAIDGVSYTYVVTLRETEDAFWTVQAYCPTEDFSKAEKDMWAILSSVTV